MCQRHAIVWIIICAFSLSACSSFRGLPSHGGGKRFDEEQRMLAAAIRHSVAKMDLSPLAGKRINIVIRNVETSGSGTTTFAGLNSLAVGGNRQFVNIDQFRPDVADNPDVAFISNQDDDRRTGTANANFAARNTYRASAFNTAKDVSYLQSVIEMKMHHQGITVSPNNAEAVLVVLVDVLGSNRSRRDQLLLIRDKLKVSCELTYYAMDANTGDIVFPSKQVGAAAEYALDYIRLTSLNWIQRKVGYSKPIVYPTLSLADGYHGDGDKNIFRQRSHRENDILSRERLLERYAEQVRYLAETGSMDQAASLLEEMRNIDPGYSNIENLEALIIRSEP